MYKLCVRKENEKDLYRIVDALIDDYYQSGGKNPGWEDLRKHCRKAGFKFEVYHEVNAYPDPHDPAMQYHVHQTNFVFKTEEEATMFMLRWS